MKRPEKNISGPHIAAARKRHRPPLTQLELSTRLKAAGVELDRAAVAKIENGLRGVLDYELAAFARALGTSVKSLIGKSRR
jgi:HTH-type transcriptional regulator, cell division transcriptional repressor